MESPKPPLRHYFVPIVLPANLIMQTVDDEHDHRDLEYKRAGAVEYWGVIDPLLQHSNTPSLRSSHRYFDRAAPVILCADTNRCR